MDADSYLITRYNYSVLVLRIIMLVVIAAVLAAFIWMIIQRLQRPESVQCRVAIYMVVGLLLIIWLLLHFWAAVRDQRFILSFGLSGLQLRKVGKTRWLQLAARDFAGYKMADYPLRFWTFKCIVIYLSSGERLELPQFLYWNFREIVPALEEANVAYLGLERSRFKWWPM